MSLQEHPDSEAALVARVTPLSKERLTQLFAKSKLGAEAVERDVNRLIHVVAVFIFDVMYSSADQPLFKLVPSKAKAAQKAAHELSQMIEELTAIDPMMIDDTYSPKERRGRLSVFLIQLEDLQTQLGCVASEYTRSAGRPAARTFVFDVACRTWMTHFGGLPSYTAENEDHPSPLVAAIQSVATDMTKDSSATASLTFAVFKKARAKIARREQIGSH